MNDEEPRLYYVSVVCFSATCEQEKKKQTEKFDLQRIQPDDAQYAIRRDFC